jgi:hypothetical protein
MYRIALIVSLVIISAHTALGISGSGTEADHWRIESLEDFNEFAADANYWAGFTRLETDVNLAGLTYTTAVIAPDFNNSNDRFDGIAFYGVFDGNDHKIINLTIDDGGAGNDYLGLFGLFDGFMGEVKNLGLEGGSVCGDCKIGGLVGENWDGFVVSHCYSNADVKGVMDVGGLVGSNLQGIVLKCHYSGSVSGEYYIGGIVGGNLGIVLNCYSDGSVSGDEYVGGLVGENGWGVSDCYSASCVNGTLYVGGLLGGNWYKVLNSYSTGDVNGLGDDIGGLVGINSGSISYCYSTGDVSGNWWFTGGLTGANEGSVLNCYSTGDVSGIGFFGGLVGRNGWEGFLGQLFPGYIFTSYSTGFVKDYGGGGLVGYNISGVIEGSFWDMETSGQVESDGGMGKTTAEMKTESTFTNAGWDFVEIWDIGEKQTYPYLRQYLLGDLNHDGRVNMLDFAILAGHWLNGAGG